MRPMATTNQRFIFAALAVCGGLNVAAAGYAVCKHPALNSDFMAFWSYPRFIAAQGPLGLYDAARLQAFQAKLYPGFHSFYPMLYPPTLLPVIWWLKDFGFAAAQTVWTVAGIAVLAAAGLAFFAPRRRAIGILAMLASPAALLNGATGETGFFTTALLLAGFAALPRHKILAGLAFGLLTLKPQLGVLIPVLLLARGDWRVIFMAGGTAVALLAGSFALFPPALWLAWAHSLPAYQAFYFAAGNALNLNIIVTVAANLVTLGVASKTAWAAQALASLAVAATLFRAARAAAPLAPALLFTGMFLAVPHAYAYDTITLIPALVLAAEAGGLTPGFTAIALIIYLGPYLLLTPASHWFLYAIPEAVLFGFCFRLAFATMARSSAAHEPGSLDGS
jgi:hypothetical protein